jgi:hypothetical protein
LNEESGSRNVQLRFDRSSWTIFICDPTLVTTATLWATGACGTNPNIETRKADRPTLIEYVSDLGGVGWRVADETWVTELALRHLPAPSIESG